MPATPRRGPVPARHPQELGLGGNALLDASTVVRHHRVEPCGEVTARPRRSPARVPFGSTSARPRARAADARCPRPLRPRSPRPRRAAPRPALNNGLERECRGYHRLALQTAHRRPAREGCVLGVVAEDRIPERSRRRPCPSSGLDSSLRRLSERVPREDAIENILQRQGTLRHRACCLRCSTPPCAERRSADCCYDDRRAHERRAPAPKEMDKVAHHAEHVVNGSARYYRSDFGLRRSGLFGVRRYAEPAGRRLNGLANVGLTRGFVARGHTSPVRRRIAAAERVARGRRWEVRRVPARAAAPRDSAPARPRAGWVLARSTIHNRTRRRGRRGPQTRARTSVARPCPGARHRWQVPLPHRPSSLVPRPVTDSR